MAGPALTVPTRKTGSGAMLIRDVRPVSREVGEIPAPWQPTLHRMRVARSINGR